MESLIKFPTKTGVLSDMQVPFLWVISNGSVFYDGVCKEYTMKKYLMRNQCRLCPPIVYIYSEITLCLSRFHIFSLWYLHSQVGTHQLRQT